VVRRQPKSSPAQRATSQRGAAPSLRAQAIRLLARREYARSELETRLRAKGAALDEINAVLDELTSLGYLSDERFARTFAAHNSGRYSRRSIAGELKAKGVGPDVIDAALAESPLDDTSALEALWRRRFGRVPVDERDKARQVRFLQARGFSVSAILALLRKARA
jgi:regulatory protein